VHPIVAPPTLRVASPPPERRRRKKSQPAEKPSLPAGLLDGSVPPINVLIVEDNIINLRVLGAFMQRLKVRWQRAMNGKEAVTKWRAGGFHLVLMDIQLPVMNGLEATKEIRRLERVNSIGVFSSGASEAPNNRLESAELGDDDKLGDRDMFKSPVIIVALTASSLQSDRHEALAAGCNDFLTKVSSPVIPHPLIQFRTNNLQACQLRLAGTQGQRVGLHAGPHRLRRVAQMERLCDGFGQHQKYDQDVDKHGQHRSIGQGSCQRRGEEGEAQEHLGRTPAARARGRKRDADARGGEFVEVFGVT
jgi:CheY-like chemotaxis protein